MFKIQVTIDARNPAIPPIWSLQDTYVPYVDGASSNVLRSLEDEDSLPSFDPVLGQIERRVNTLECNALFFDDNLEESYYWIIMHQLHFIMVEWTAYQQSIEFDNGSDYRGRVWKGLDRQPVISCFHLFFSGTLIASKVGEK